MKLTCLSKGGGGYHSPACHMLEVCGLRLLLECPLDLSAIAAFAPLPTAATASRLDASCGLISAVPWYKTPKNLHLWDTALIDAVLLSSPTAMLGLPFLTRHPKFSAKIYATEATARIGRLMMEELVAMHVEFVRFYGLDERPGFPEWMKWEELEKLPPEVKKVVMGEDGEELGSWLPLYSATDVKECLSRVQPLKYAEEACYNGTLVFKAFSSGLEIGSCNWTINCPRRNITYLSCSIFKSAHAMEFDYHSLQGNDVIIFSDFSSLNGIVHDRKDADRSETKTAIVDEDHASCNLSTIRADHDREKEISKCLLGIDESSEESNKINYLCSVVVNFLKEGRSVLVPIGRLGIILLLLEQISQSLEYLNLQVPMFMISVSGEEILAYTSSVPEWLCKQRQEKLFSGEPLFGHVDLIKEERLHLLPKLSSSRLLLSWQEPCIVFCPHWTLRLGPVVQLLQRWHVDDKCLLILEQEVIELAFLPFKSFEIKALQCSFLSGLKMQKVQSLLEILKPKLVLFPEDLRFQVAFASDSSTSFIYYLENLTVRVPSLSADFEAFLSTDLAYQLQPRRLTQENIAIARLKGQLLLRNGKYVLVPAKRLVNLSKKQLLHWGSFDPTHLLQALQEKGISGAINRSKDVSDDGVCSIHVTAPEEAVIETSAKKTVIFAVTENMAALIYEALSSVCNGI